MGNVAWCLIGSKSSNTVDWLNQDALPKSSDIVGRNMLDCLNTQWDDDQLAMLNGA